MHKLYFILVLIAPFILPAQKRIPLPHGMTFGHKVNPLQKMQASQLEAYMDKMTRISTTITGKVLQVDTPKGGWFQMDAGNGKIIKVHFKDYNITIPKQLKGRNVMIQGVAQKLFVTNDTQHIAKKQHIVNINPKPTLTFEATGLMVD